MFPPETRFDRPSDAPLAIDMTGSGSLPRGGWASGLSNRIPPTWVGMSGYLAAGVFLGLVLILALSLGRSRAAVPAAASAGPSAITDNVVHLHATELGDSCWRELGRDVGRAAPARLTVSLEVGVDGRVRYAVASGASASMRGCVEAHVKSWEFLPQAQAQIMALPVEIDRR